MQMNEDMEADDLVTDMLLLFDDANKILDENCQYDDASMMLEDTLPSDGQDVVPLPTDLRNLNVSELLHYPLENTRSEEFYPGYNSADHITDPVCTDSSLELESLYSPLSAECPPSPPETTVKFELPPEAFISSAQPYVRVKEEYSQCRYYDGSCTERISSPHHMPYVHHTPVKHENKTLRFRRTKDAKLWEFLWDLLEKRIAEGAIKWLSQDRGVFKILNSGKVAKLWGDHKRKSNMKYEFMARAIRFYYKSGIMSRIPNQRLTYQFGPVAFDLKNSGR